MARSGQQYYSWYCKMSVMRHWLHLTIARHRVDNQLLHRHMEPAEFLADLRSYPARAA